MKKIVLVAFALMLLVPTVHATQARLAGMGLANWMIADDANMWMNPVYVKDYSGGAWWDMGTNAAAITAGQWGGATMGTALGTFGAFFSRPYVGVGTAAIRYGTNGAPAVAGVPVDDVLNASSAAFYPALSFFGLNGAQQITNLVATAPANKVDIFFAPSFLPIAFAYNFAKAGGYAQYEYWTSPNKANGDGYQYNEAYTYEHNIGVGLRLADLIPVLPIEIAGVLGLPTVNNHYHESTWNNGNQKFDTTDEILTTPGAFNLAVSARMPVELLGQSTIVFGQYALSNLPAILTDTWDNDVDAALDGDYQMDRTYSRTAINGGISVNKEIGEGLLVVAVGGMYTVTSYTAEETDPTGGVVANLGKYTRTTTAIGIPINIAYEHPLSFFGLMGRAGLAFTPAWGSVETVDQDYLVSVLANERKVIIPADATVPVAITLGLGKDITDTLSVDLLVNQAAVNGILGALTTQMTINWMFQ